MTREELIAAIKAKVACPKCGAAVGEPCRKPNKSEWKNGVHIDRANKYAAEDR